MITDVNQVGMITSEKVNRRRGISCVQKTLLWVTPVRPGVS